MSSPAISVVMSVYNGERFLAEAVDSILNQTFTDFEFIIIDDGSTDRTSQILSDYASRDPRVRVISRENKGRTASLNIGIGLAKGKYIARMDADDVALPHRFKDQVDFLEAHAAVALLGGAIEMISFAGKMLRESRPPVSDTDIRAVIMRDNPFWHPTVMMRKDTVVAVRGFREAFEESEDYDLWLRIAEVSQLANLDQIVLRYRVHGRQASVSHARRQIECVFAARAAAALRARGAADPLWDAVRITPDVVHSMGITPEDVRRAELARCMYWIDAFRGADADSTLPVISTATALCNSSPNERVMAATLLMEAASIHYRKRQFGRALACAGRAILHRPATVGRHLKMAVARRTRPSAA